MDPEELEELKRKEDEGAHKSGVDRANDLLNKAKRLRQLKNATSTLRSGTSAAEGVGTAAGSIGAEGAATAGGAAAAEGAIAGGAVAEGAVAAGGGGILAAGGIPLIIIGLIALLIAVIFIVILGTGNNVNAGTPPTTSADCQIDLRGICQAAGSTCASPNTPDTSGAVCSNQATPLCCVPPATKPAFHFFCQYDNSWTKYASSLGRTCHIDNNGCTPTSVAMITYSLGKTNWNPYNVAVTNGGNGCFAGGSSFWDFVPFMRNQGLKVLSGVDLAEGHNFNVSSAIKYLNQGCYLIAAANMTFSYTGAPIGDSSGNHQTVITGVSPNGILTVMDPTFCHSDTNYKARTFSAFNRSTIFNWLGVHPICP